ncbi:hypothetical protein GCM10010168_85010 [Actinoplanes ianthinogenes]|uniref:Lipoprotein n=1 Tax=Actinoplanes ianthinogenes TaxID=122358 RepID=A0ABN6CH79_9ACTN|nr:hypothetical protein [Actinoplanes ianthinogenes]BCJ44925.1 hypothetical protein Aiant_55820 [Actinoplanes ianthinogenes]GGR52981.1 hypothetical protein GCM10010168_85010 [Actinoplanes ianthinogenes]
MRRHFAAVAALSFALLGAGCSGGDKQEPTAAAPTPATDTAAATTAAADPAVAASADAALSADTKAICAQAERTGESFGTNFAADYQVFKGAKAQGAEARARAKEKVARTVDGYAYALLDMSKLTSDPSLKKALASMGAQVTALKGDFAKIDDKQLAGISAKLAKACGKS